MFVELCEHCSDPNWTSVNNQLSVFVDVEVCIDSVFRQRVFQLIQSVCVSRFPVPFVIGLREVAKRLCDRCETGNVPRTVVCETQQTSDLFRILWLVSQFDVLDFLGIRLCPLGTEYLTKELKSALVECALVLVHG